MKTVDPWVTSACALVVALYAMQRYDTPETNRLSTTRRLFLASGTGYVVASLLVYALLSEVVLKPGMLQLFGLQDVTKLLAQYAAAPVLAAVVLTTLLPQAPMLKRVDAVLLEWFQRLGRIPSGVSHLADALTLDRIAIAGSDLGLSRDWILREGDVPNLGSALIYSILLRAVIPSRCLYRWRPARIRLEQPARWRERTSLTSLAGCGIS